MLTHLNKSNAYYVFEDLPKSQPPFHDPKINEVVWRLEPGQICVCFLFLFQTPEVRAEYPSDVFGKAYMWYNGRWFPLKDTHIFKEAFKWNCTDAGCIGSYINPIDWYYTDNNGDYRISNYNPTYGGPGRVHNWPLDNPWASNWCGDAENNIGGWCGMNCGQNPNRWKIYLPANYDTANFPEGMNLTNGKWKMTKENVEAVSWVAGDYYILQGNNDASYYDFNFEWEPNKYCSVSLSSSLATEGTPVTVTLKGLAHEWSQEPVRIWVEKQDGSSIAPPPPESDHRVYNSIHYYKVGECQSAMGSCTTTINLNNLRPGNYKLHCDLPTDPGKCSGNPFCTYYGGSVDCSGWAKCSAADDHKSLTVNSAAINGGWSAWSECTVVCGGGAKTRTCNNPSPANGGSECIRIDGTSTTPGNRLESQECNTQDCVPAWIKTSGGDVHSNQ